MDIISVIIATYNSAKLLPRVLDSIKQQTYPQECIEILIVDGGSKDTTLDLAEQYGCRIIHNPKTEPVHAKLLGVQEATGKYLVTLDHDEVLENKDSFLKRVKLLDENPECKVAFCSGYKRPKNYPALNQYISEFGDPFSLFMYRYSKDYKFFGGVLKRKSMLLYENDEYIKVSFKKMKGAPIIELCCLGTMINLDFFKSQTKISSDSREMVHLFYVMLNKGIYDVVMTKNDPLVHYSVDSLQAYFPKLKWRICNNIHFSEKAENGFTGRTEFQHNLKYKKFLFIPYAFSGIISCIDALMLAITRHNYIYLLHPILCIYVAVEIIWQIFLKLIGFTPSFRSYDGKKKIER